MPTEPLPPAEPVAIPTPQPVPLKNATAVFVLDGKSYDYSEYISQVLLQPAQSTTSWTAITGKTSQVSSATSWTVQLSLAQDFDQAGFLRFLGENDGKRAILTTSMDGGATTATITVTLVAAAIGGTADGSVLVSQVTLPADGSPAWS